MATASAEGRPGTVWTPGRIAWAIGAASTLAALLTLAGPGITVDEPLDVGPGRAYLATLKARGLDFFRADVADAMYRNNAEHPPLGRWLLGIASTAGQPIEVILRGGPDPVGLYVVSARVAPAIVFGLAVVAVSGFAGSRFGRAAGAAAGLSLALMPRVFAHAHVAALDTFIMGFFTFASLAIARASARPRVLRAMVPAGLLWALALLTKIQAWFLAPIALGWLVAKLGARRGSAAFGVWLVVGLSGFFAGWPWLWADPAARLMRYLGTGVDRVPIRVLYFGSVYLDRDVPWHYPWFYLAATVPAGLLAFAAVGLAGGRGRGEPAATIRYLAAIAATFLALFSTNVPVYDGERLFLVIFPCLAILAGAGYARLRDRAGPWLRRGLAAGLILQGTGLAMVHPFGLSYYNLLVGGLPGAERMGLELAYWSEAVDPVLLDRLGREVREGDSAAMAPTLAPDQGKVATTRALARIPVVIQDQDAAARSDWLVVSRRSSYWTDAVRDRLAADVWVASRSRQGVWLSVLLRKNPKAP